MKKRQSVFIGILVCIILAMTACGKTAVQEPVAPEITPTATPEPTVTPAPITTSEVIATPVLTVTPEATTTPEATITPEPTVTPEATITPEATTTPEATVAPEPTTTPEVTVVPETTTTPEPTTTPAPTATPKPTATPVPTPKPGAEVTVKFYAPLILKDMSTIEATDAMDFLNKMSVYSWPKKGTATETAMLSERASEYFKNAGEVLLQNGVISDSAKEILGEDATVSCNGWYDKNRSWYDSAYFIEKSDYYSNFSSKTFADLGIQKGETLEVYATYTVKTADGTTAYMPCILDVQLDMGIFKTTMTYMMAMPIWERILLPELPGYTMEWQDNGMIMSSDKICIYDETINHYTLVVKPK